MDAICKLKPEPGASLIDVHDPQQLPAGHVLVRVSHTSLCGTDLHVLAWDAFAASRVRPPIILGHEFTGTIEAFGEGVTGLSVGDRVAGESHIVCGTCPQCANGHGHVCQETSILGIDTDGVWARYAIVPAANARKIDVRIPAAVAAIQDPLGNAVHATLAAGDLMGRTVLVTGCGPIGLFCIGIARACGAARIIATETSHYRLALAEQMGADILLNPSVDDCVWNIQRATNGSGVDVALEMSGHPDSLGLITQSIGWGATISLLGIYSSDRVVTDLNTLIFRGITIRCIVGRRLYETWDTMQELLIGGLDVNPVITHYFGYQDFDAAVALIRKGQTGKVVFCWE